MESRTGDDSNGTQHDKRGVIRNCGQVMGEGRFPMWHLLRKQEGRCIKESRLSGFYLVVTEGLEDCPEEFLECECLMNSLSN